MRNKYCVRNDSVSLKANRKPERNVKMSRRAYQSGGPVSAWRNCAGAKELPTEEKLCTEIHCEETKKKTAAKKKISATERKKRHHYENIFSLQSLALENSLRQRKPAWTHIASGAASSRSGGGGRKRLPSAWKLKLAKLKAWNMKKKMSAANIEYMSEATERKAELIFNETESESENRRRRRKKMAAADSKLSRENDLLKEKWPEEESWRSESQPVNSMKLSRSGEKEGERNTEASSWRNGEAVSFKAAYVGEEEKAAVEESLTITIEENIEKRRRNIREAWHHQQRNGPRESCLLMFSLSEAREIWRNEEAVTMKLRES